MRSLPGGRAAVAVAATAVAILSLLPFAYLFAAGISAEAITKLFSYPNTAALLARTIGITLSTTLTALVLGIFGAIIVVRTDVPGRKLLTVLLTAPLAVPLFVNAYAGYSASLVFAPGTEIVTSFTGATAIIALVLYPYVFLACVIALRNVDPAQEEVARSLRSRPLAVFWRVTLPQLRTALASSGLIVALHVLSEYGAMMQTRQRTLTTRIMSEMLDFGDYDSARSLSVLLAVIAMAVIGLGRLVSGRETPLSVSSQTTRMPVRIRLGSARIPLLLLTLAIPTAALSPTVFMTVRGLLSPHRHLAVNWSNVLASATTTFSYAAWAGLIATVCALPVSWWVTRHPSLRSNLAERSVWLAHSIPNAILALALVFLAIHLVPDFYKTAPLLVLAYVILYLPLAVTNQNVGLQGAMVKYDEAAASLGASSFGRFRRVTFPIALPGIATGALLVGLDASKELTTSLMLMPFNTQTLATGLWSTTAGETLDFTAAAPYSAMLLILGAVPVYLIVHRTLRFIP